MVSMVYGRLNPVHIDLLSKIMEAYGHLGIVSTVNAKAGLVVICATPETLNEVQLILANLPFPLYILSDQDQLSN